MRLVGLVQVILAVGWTGASHAHTPSGTEATSALVSAVVTLGVLLWGRRIERRQAEKILPFRRD